MEGERDIKIWDQHFTSNGFTQTVPNFWALVRIFIQLKFENNTDAYDNHKDYLRAQTKKKEMTVTNFESQVRYHNHSVLPWLPGAPPVRLDAMLSEPEFKSLIYKAMPGAWRDKYEEHNTQNNSTLEQIMTFMERRYLAGDKKKDTSHGNSQTAGRGNGNGNGGGRG